MLCFLVLLLGVVLAEEKTDRKVQVEQLKQLLQSENPNNDLEVAEQRYGLFGGYGGGHSSSQEHRNPFGFNPYFGNIRYPGYNRGGSSSEERFGYFGKK